MNGLASLTRFRRTHTLRAMTVLLVVLVVTPFTPPFSTCGLGVLVGQASTHLDLVAADKKINDLVSDLVSHTSTLLVVAVAIPVRATACRVDALPSPQFVLRI
jgi:hypothetical protein